MFCGSCGQTLKKSDKFCESCGTPSKVKAGVVSVPIKTTVADYPLDTTPPQSKEIINKNSRAKLFLIAMAVVAILGLVGYIVHQNDLRNKQLLSDLSEKNLSETEKAAVEAQKLSNLKAIVNILCDNGNGGSGTIFSEEGLVLTNHHVVSDSTTCIVTLPDTDTGTPISIYLSTPIIVPTLSEQYDIAMLNIDASYTDDEGKTWGAYPTVFPTYVRPDICDSTSLKLGDTLKIYGYPVTSGGENLTVTEGIVSSFADDRTILTSAKIDSGNSGGFAIDANGCNIGIPSAVIQGQYQNFGVIISAAIIKDFLDEVPLSETSNKTIEDITPLPQSEENSNPVDEKKMESEEKDKSNYSEGWIDLENGIHGWAFDGNKNYKVILTFQSINNPSYTFTAYSDSSVLDSNKQHGSFFWGYRPDVADTLRAKGIDVKEVRSFQFSSDGYATTNPDIPYDDYRLIMASYNGNAFKLPATVNSHSYRVCPHGYTNYYECYQ